MLLAQINQETAAEAVKNCIAVLPIGATEVHGNHLPVGTDSFLAAGCLLYTSRHILSMFMIFAALVLLNI